MARILIIDDDPTIPAMLAQLFSEQRHDDVTIAREPDEGLRAVEQVQPEVVVMACGTVVWDAWTLVTQVRHASALVLYGLLTPQAEARYAPLAATVPFLNSPFTVDEVLAARDAALERTVSHS